MLQLKKTLLTMLVVGLIFPAQVFAKTTKIAKPQPHVIPQSITPEIQNHVTVLLALFMQSSVDEGALLERWAEFKEQELVSPVLIAEWDSQLKAHPTQETVLALRDSYFLNIKDTANPEILEMVWNGLTFVSLQLLAKHFSIALWKSNKEEHQKIREHHTEVFTMQICFKNYIFMSKDFVNFFLNNSVYCFYWYNIFASFVFFYSNFLFALVTIDSTSSSFVD